MGCSNWMWRINRQDKGAVNPYLKVDISSNRGTVQGPIGMDEDQQNGARLFPNPAKSHITIALSNASAYTTVEVFDIGGRKVLEKNLEGVLNTVSLSGLNPGVYFFRLSGKYGQANHRIVKH